MRAACSSASSRPSRRPCTREAGAQRRVRPVTERDRYDVLVVGGGAGGAGAAIGAARTGARVLLVERYGFLGGAATNAQVLSYCGFFACGGEPRAVVAGVGAELLGELRALGLDTAPVRSKSGNWIVMIDPEATKLAFDRLVLQQRMDLRLHTRLVGAARVDGRIDAVTLADHRGVHRVAAACYVDASGEASLASYAGVPLRQPGGPGAQLQPASFPVRIGGVNPEAVVDRSRMTALIAAYNATASIPIARADGGVLARLPVSGDFWWMAIDLDTDGLSGAELARAETSARERAWQSLGVLRQLPGFEGAYIVSTGPQIGIRETRRPHSRQDVTAGDGHEGRRRPDAVARAGWPMEVHEAPGRTRFVALGGEGFFDIPLDALRAREVDNLWLAGRVIGADSEAYGSVRVMGTAFATGQAAGVAAGQAANGGPADAQAVRQALRSQGALV